MPSSWARPFASCPRKNGATLWQILSGLAGASNLETPLMSVKVKICGLTNLADAQVALDAGADFLGFILYAKSPRYIAPAQLAQLLAELDLPSHVQTVGVFVNTPVEE